MKGTSFYPEYAGDLTEEERIAPFRETLDVVMDALGTTPERFAEPLCWEEENSERYLKCLQYHDFYSIDRNGERYDCAVFIPDHLYTDRAKKAAALLPTERLSRQQRII